MEESENSEEVMLVSGASDSLATEEALRDDLLAFQTKLWALLERRAALYTSGESSSVPLLTAHDLLESVLFVLGVDPDDIEPEQLRRLARGDLEEEFEVGLQVVREKVDQARGLWQEVVLTTPLLESIALKDTLNSIERFLDSYDYRYFAAEITCDIDYQLCHAVPESLLGIDYVNEYLHRLLLENNFMQLFDLERCRALLRKVSPAYRDLIINLFEPIASNAIGLALAEEDVLKLHATDVDRVALESAFIGASRPKAEKLLMSAAETVCCELRIDDANTQAYLKKLAINLWPRIEAVASKGGLSGVFL